MEKHILFQRLYGLLQDTAEALGAGQETSLVEAMFAGDLLSRWRDLCLELSGFPVEEFRSWARHKNPD